MSLQFLEESEASVPCYGCGRTYRALDEKQSHEHCHHLGDSNLSRETLLEWLDKLQAERDEWIRTAFAAEG